MLLVLRHANGGHRICSGGSQNFAFRTYRTAVIGNEPVTAYSLVEAAILDCRLLWLLRVRPSRSCLHRPDLLTNLFDLPTVAFATLKVGPQTHLP